MTAHAAARGPAPDDVITTTALVKTYRQGTDEVRALDGVSVAVRRARFTAVVGPSGSGKSTLMHCVAGLDTVTSGSVVLDGTELTGLSDRQLTRVRRKRIGFVFQSFNLLPQLTAYENIVLPVTMSGRRPDRERVDHLCEVLGIAHRLSTAPPNCPAGSSSGSPSPARWSPAPPWSSPTSPPAISTPGPAPRCSPCCAGPSTNSARRS